jgi:phage baseplate assembly protein W
MSGIDWTNGKEISGWAATVQAIAVLFTTHIGTRVMLRSYGANLGRLLGAPLNVTTLTKFRAGLTAALELWEPRFRVHVALIEPGANSPETLRQGRLGGLMFEGEYRPRGHLGDPTPEGDVRRIFVGLGQSGMEVTG